MVAEQTKNAMIESNLGLVHFAAQAYRGRGVPYDDLVQEGTLGLMQAVERFDPGRRVKFWFPGGSSAPVLLEEDLDRPYSFESMAEAGSMLGSGAIIVVDDSVPVVSVALRLAEFYRHESCGKCVPCREGTNWTVKTLERIDSGEATPMDLEIMAQVQTNIIGNCLCVLGDSMAMPVGSMIEKFRPEFEEHIERARERAERLSVEMGVAAPPADAAA